MGVELLLEKIYDAIDYDQMGAEIFKNLVIVRITYQVNKLKTTNYLKRYFSINLNEDKIYRYLDKPYKDQKESIQPISKH
jgi:histidyl-tRNA synthetase